MGIEIGGKGKIKYSSVQLKVVGYSKITRSLSDEAYLRALLIIPW